MALVRTSVCLTILLSILWVRVSAEDYSPVDRDESETGDGDASSGIAPIDNRPIAHLDLSQFHPNDGSANHGFKASVTTFLPVQHVSQKNLKIAALKNIPVLYNIQTNHDPVYKVYLENIKDRSQFQPDSKKQSLWDSSLKPAITNVEIKHPEKYKVENSNLEILDDESKIIIDTHVPGSTGSQVRVRRYAGSRRYRRQKKKHQEDDDEDEHEPHYAHYSSRPKEFNSELYSSPYKKAQNYEYSSPYKKAKDGEYPYDFNYDSGYDHGEYERIKKLSEEQAAEIKQNPDNCKEVVKDGSTCTVCKDPKTGGNYESCAYVSEPKSKQYAYSREKSFDSKDQPEEKKDDDTSTEAKPGKYTEDRSSEETPKEESSESESVPSYKSTYKEPSSAPYTQASEPQPYDGYKREDNEGDPEKYQSYYISSSNPNPKPAALKAADDSSEDQSSEKAYGYQKGPSGFYTDNESKKDVESVLAEFKKKDRSACKKVNKNGMTCYQCLDDNGLKHEECMFVSESAPKRSRLAYQELKEYTSKPPSLDDVASEAESRIVTTTSPFIETSSEGAVEKPSPYGSKLKRKKVKGQVETTSTTATTLSSAPRSVPLQLQEAAASSLVPMYPPRITKSNISKRSHSDNETPKKDEEIAELNAQIPVSSKIAPPEEFAGDSSRGAFWAETQPVYSKTLGVTLPEFMLSRSEFEEAFDETVSGA